MKMDKMENVDFVRKRYATILRGIYSHSQIEVVALSNLNIMSLTNLYLEARDDLVISKNQEMHFQFVVSCCCHSISLTLANVVLLTHSLFP